MSGFTEKRKFFLEVIDDMAKEEVENARLLDKTPDEIANSEPCAPLDDELALSPVRFREEMEEASDEELLLHRHVAAKAVCQYVSDVGFLFIDPIHSCLLSAVARLRIIDAEVVRRHLVAGDDPPPV
jgi:hypothetical protein